MMYRIAKFTYPDGAENFRIQERPTIFHKWRPSKHFKDATYSAYDAEYQFKRFIENKSAELSAKSHQPTIECVKML